MERLDQDSAHTFEWMELCDRKFSSVSWACEKHTSQLGVRPRFWYMLMLMLMAVDRLRVVDASLDEWNRELSPSR